MRKSLVAALAAVSIFAVGMPANRAEATFAAARPAPGGAATASAVREAAIVCGGNGCNAVQTKASKRRKFQTLGHG